MKQAIWLINHTRIHSGNQPVLTNEGKDFGWCIHMYIHCIYISKWTVIGVRGITGTAARSLVVWASLLGSEVVTVLNLRITAPTVKGTAKNSNDVKKTHVQVNEEFKILNLWKYDLEAVCFLIVLCITLPLTCLL